MAKSQKRKTTRNPEETRTALLDAAEAEFNTRGFFETDSNRIARAAGYAPQTFYRHFEDKTAIFLAVYDRWWRSETGAVSEIAQKPSERALEAMADTMIAFHTRWRGFRRSLRHLAIVDERVRKARAEARLAQMTAIRALPGQPKRSEAALTAALLKLERLCDAAAENEFVDLGLTKRDARAAVIEAARFTHGSAKA